MRSQTKNALLGRGFPTDLIDKIERLRLTVGVLALMSRAQLGRDFDKAEIDLIVEKIKRQPISEDVLARVIDAADGACSYCADGDFSRPYQIHHIEEYATSQDNSEDNLLLVCPTHHVSVPKSQSQAAQKATRRRWHAVVQVAKAYRAKGVPFPFGRFVAYDFGSPPSPAALIDDYRVPPSTAVAFATSDLALEVERRLASKGFVLLIGQSGSGKTTLAVGVAGRIAATGRLVFRYDLSKVQGGNPLADVLNFIYSADRPSVLLLDDAFLDFREHQLAEVRAAIAGSPVVVLATWTSADGSDDPRVERQFPDAMQVTWSSLRPTVRDFLLANQAVVVPAIQNHQGASGTYRVGLGKMDVSLEDHISHYDGRAKTVSEFLFLVRGGSDAVRQDLARLVQADRADVPVLYAAIEQLAGFERTVSPEEAAAACPARPDGSPLPAASPEWVEEVFLEECRRRRMQRLRGEYTTLHRDWARRLLGAALGNEPSRQDVERILARDFNCRTKEPLRLMRLWAGLQYDEFGGPFVREWIGRQSRAEGPFLVESAANQGLGVLGVVAGRLHSTFLRAPAVTAAAFTPHEQLLTRAVAAAGPEDWYSLRQLLMALAHAAPECAARVVEKWDPRTCASVLGATDPIYYEAARWFFTEASRCNRAWVKAVGRDVSWDAISRSLDRTLAGHVDDVLQCQSLLSLVGIPTLRSMVRRYGEVIRAALRDARLSETNACPLDGMMINLFFPLEIAQSLEAMDAHRVAAELQTGPARLWSTFTELASLALEGDTDWPAEVIDALDSNQLARSVESQAHGNEYELRVFLFGLARGREPKRRELAERLYPMVVAAAHRSELERENLTKAFFQIDQELGEQMAAEVGLDFDVAAEMQKLQVRSTRRDDLVRLRRQIIDLDEKGEDFDVSRLLGPMTEGEESHG